MQQTGDVRSSGERAGACREIPRAAATLYEVRDYRVRNLSSLAVDRRSNTDVALRSTHANVTPQGL